MKKTLLLLSTCVLLCLPGCSTISGKEVSGDKFLDQINDLPQHNYVKAKSVLERKRKSNNSSYNQKETCYYVYTSNYGWELDSNKVQEGGLYSPIVGGRAATYYNSSLHAYSSSAKSHYYINPLKIEIEQSDKTTLPNGAYIYASSMYIYEFNKYGLVTKETIKYVNIKENSVGKFKSTETSVTKISYS